MFERPAGSGVWWIDYRGRDGKRRRQKIGGKRAALDAYTARLIASGKSEVVLQPAEGIKNTTEIPITFGELAAERMEYKKLHLAPGSLKTGRIRLEPLLAAFGSLPATSLTPELIDKFLAALIEGAAQVDGSRAQHFSARAIHICQRGRDMRIRHGRGGRGGGLRQVAQCGRDRASGGPFLNLIFAVIYWTQIRRSEGPFVLIQRYRSIGASRRGK